MSRKLTLFPASAEADTAEPSCASVGHWTLHRADDLDAAQAHRRAAEECLAAQRFRSARRHSVAALRRSPADARDHYLLGRAWESDPMGCDRRAARHYRKAVKLNASEPIYRAALGRALVRIDETRSGVNVLRRAAEAAPADPDVLALVVDGLREAGEVKLAFELLSKARFLAPADTAVRQLWNRVRFDILVQEQRVSEQPRPREPEPPSRVVPFMRVVGGHDTSRARVDRSSLPTAHVGRLLKPFRG